MTTIQATLQAKIDAQQDHATLEYGIRSIRACRNPYGASPAHAAQIHAATLLAADVLQQHVGRDKATLWFLRLAKRRVGERVAEATAALQAVGTKRQLRLALAGVA